MVPIGPPREATGVRNSAFNTWGSRDVDFLEIFLKKDEISKLDGGVWRFWTFVESGAMVLITQAVDKSLTRAKGVLDPFPFLRP